MSSATENLEVAHKRAVSVRAQVGGFPYLAEVLRRAGVHRYQHMVPAATSLYFTEAGPVVSQASPIVDGFADVAPWNREALIAALRADQAGETDYGEFTQACWQAGVVHYEVDLSSRTCTYVGAADERYVESYADVDLPAG